MKISVTFTNFALFYDFGFVSGSRTNPADTEI
jgi:hypothetical protein